ncbi:MAG: VacB/RNase II family 3'-5' exoribonuclease [Flavobacteriaceae bacterium]|nr:VacB/RNase II family 3'-5' exoribonuclease [Flavobacteriaceae bacterium]
MKAEGILEYRWNNTGIFAKHLTEGNVWVIIRSTRLKRALLGDRVSIEYKYNRGSEYNVGRVLEVLKRTDKPLVASVVFKFDNYLYKIESKTISSFYFFVDPLDAKEINLGQRVLIRFKTWHTKQRYPIGELIKTIKEQKRHKHVKRVYQIALDNGFYESFPTEILKNADHLDHSIPSSEIQKRKDFRDVLTFTIDEVTAKDLDDAISFRQLPNNHFEVGVHIADVTHYLKKDSLIDKEAFSRGTSVYFIDQVIPMLPESLSNGLCSLNTCEDKLTFSVLFEMNQEGSVLKTDYAKTIIQSNNRLSYTQVQRLIDSQNISSETEDSQVGKMSTELQKALLCLFNITGRLRSERISNGSLMIRSEEVIFEVNSNADPQKVRVHSQNEAQQLIEELMLLANKSVAEFLSRHHKKIPSVYRIHDFPDSDGIGRIYSRLISLGFKLNTQSDQVKSQLNKAIESFAETPNSYWLSTLISKAMSKAAYKTNNIGHYGLGFDYYTHFTSPIRRYPDVIVHRILHAVLSKNETPYQKREELEELCDHCNYKELYAVKVERDVQKYMQCLYMLKLKGTRKTHIGCVSGFSKYGMFVELIENKCQGMVFLRRVPGANFSPMNNHWYVITNQGRKEIQLGDLLEVSIGNVSLEKMYIDFHFIRWVYPDS